MWLLCCGASGFVVEIVLLLKTSVYIVLRSSAGKARIGTDTFRSRVG
jgi:hypothetical protein